ncbi:hypothetical protein RBSH_03896 [Rhodopirellula baltica SH28]|uniref:Uncharacterized protein n=1 Tax=Rhodopirellula baltica SH28 TaxID=993517 RepID=K5DDG3_RHOBT|nr:hypothetical protein RBSH_03896 [Rhodopirellula baltica SH28]
MHRTYSDAFSKRFCYMLSLILPAEGTACIPRINACFAGNTTLGFAARQTGTWRNI